MLTSKLVWVFYVSGGVPSALGSWRAGSLSVEAGEARAVSSSGMLKSQVCACQQPKNGHSTKRDKSALYLSLCPGSQSVRLVTRGTLSLGTRSVSTSSLPSTCASTRADHSAVSSYCGNAILFSKRPKKQKKNHKQNGSFQFMLPRQSC